MSTSDYLQGLASRFGLHYLPKAKPFAVDPLMALDHKGTILGQRNGRLLAMSMLKGHNQQQLAIMIRFPKVSGDTKPMEDAVKQAFGVGKLAVAKRVKVTPDSVVLGWQYSLKKPGAEEVARTLDAVASAISAFAGAFDGRCEDCGQGKVSEITLMNDVPGYHCAGCQAKIASAKQQEADEYSRRAMGLPKAVACSTIAMLAAALAFAAIYYVFESDGKVDIRMFLIAPFAISLALTLTFSKTVRRIDVWKQAPLLIAFVLVACVLADVGYYSFFFARCFHVPLSLRLVENTAMLLPQIRFSFDWHIWATLCQVGAAASSVGLLKRLQPKFQSVFVPISAVLANGR